MSPGIKKHMISIGIGCIMGIGGLLLWQNSQNIDIPIISLSKIGVVLAILGGIEVLISGFALAHPATRHKQMKL